MFRLKGNKSDSVEGVTLLTEDENSIVDDLGEEELEQETESIITYDSDEAIEEFQWTLANIFPQFLNITFDPYKIRDTAPDALDSISYLCWTKVIDEETGEVEPYFDDELYRHMLEASILQMHEVMQYIAMSAVPYGTWFPGAINTLDKIRSTITSAYTKRAIAYYFFGSDPALSDTIDIASQYEFDEIVKVFPHLPEWLKYSTAELLSRFLYKFYSDANHPSFDSPS